MIDRKKNEDKKTKHQFKIGDRVVFVDVDFGDKKHFPLWGGKYGYVTGKVVHLGYNEGHNSICTVCWGNGVVKELRECRLARYTWRYRLIKLQANSESHFITRAFKIVVIVASAVMVVDYFLLGGKVANSIKAAFENGIKKGVVDK